MLVYQRVIEPQTKPSHISFLLKYTLLRVFIFSQFHPLTLHLVVQQHIYSDGLLILRAGLRVVPVWSYERQWEAHFSAQAQCFMTLVHL